MSGTTPSPVFRGLLLASCLLSVLLGAGVVFGYSGALRLSASHLSHSHYPVFTNSTPLLFAPKALKEVLIAEGVYANLCNTTSSAASSSSKTRCLEQELRLDLMFALASSLTNVG
jgi:hypothetical protein